MKEHVMGVPSGNTALGNSVADKDYQLAEYHRLCSEVEKRVELGIQFFDRLLAVTERCAGVAGIFLTLAGVVIGIGPRLIGSAYLINVLLMLCRYAAAIALLGCPILLAFLAGFVGENDLRIGQINHHIKHEHEAPHLPRGWETVRHQLFKAMPWLLRKEQRAQYHCLAPRRGRKLLSMRGLFITVQGIFLFAAWMVAAMGSINFF